MLAYPVILEADADYIMVTSPDFPELTTFGDDRDEALMRAVDALEEAIAARMYDNRDIPEPSDGKTIVELPLRTEAKITAYQNNGLSFRTHMMPRQSWTREQELAVLYLKVEIGKNGLSQKHPAIYKLAKAMGRTETAIWKRKLNFDYLDNSAHGGYSHPAKLTKAVWQEYTADRERIRTEARKAYSNLLKTNH